MSEFFVSVDGKKKRNLEKKIIPIDRFDKYFKKVKNFKICNSHIIVI